MVALQCQHPIPYQEKYDATQRINNISNIQVSHDAAPAIIERSSATITIPSHVLAIPPHDVEIPTPRVLPTMACQSNVGVPLGPDTNRPLPPSPGVDIRPLSHRMAVSSEGTTITTPTVQQQADNLLVHARQVLDPHHPHAGSVVNIPTGQTTAAIAAEPVPGLAGLTAGQVADLCKIQSRLIRQEDMDDD
jgi:hypothetical protein